MTMTSRVIAELTGKELGHVHRDIRAMLDELKKDDPNLDHPQEDKDARGYTTCYQGIPGTGLSYRERLDDTGNTGSGKRGGIGWVVWLVIAIVLMGVLFGR